MASRSSGRRKPATLTVLEGNPGRRPVKAVAELPLATGGPEAPPGMPEGARRFWQMLAPVLQRVGLLTEADLPALADLCVCLHRLQQAEERIETEGLVVDGLHGPVQNPAVAAAKTYRAAAQTWAKRFGLDPYSRGALDVVPQETKDEMARLLEER